MVIKWDEYSFTPPILLDDWDEPKEGGVYAITFRKCPQTKPNTHTILYFGETGDFSTRGIDDSHHKFRCWKSNSTQNVLYVSTHSVYAETKRKNIEDKLIAKYNPPCND